MDENNNVSIDNIEELSNAQLDEVDGGFETPVIYFQCRECEYRTFDFETGERAVCPRCGGKLRPHKI